MHHPLLVSFLFSFSLFLLTDLTSIGRIDVCLFDVWLIVQLCWKQIFTVGRWQSHCYCCIWPSPPSYQLYIDVYVANFDNLSLPVFWLGRSRGYLIIAKCLQSLICELCRFRWCPSLTFLLFLFLLEIFLLQGSWWCLPVSHLHVGCLSCLLLHDCISPVIDGSHFLQKLRFWNL